MNPVQHPNPEAAFRDLEMIRSRQPLIHNVTNFVVMQQTANALLALGASPIMAHAPEELEEMVGIASALVLNIGTLDKTWISIMKKAQKYAVAKGTPIILDPVGVGASRLRTHTALDLLESGPPSVVRGNAAEILALSGDNIQSKGVDSQYGSDVAKVAAGYLSEKYGCVVAITGEVDYVVHGKQVHTIAGGCPLLTKVVGTGCTVTALTGAFCAVNKNFAQATSHALWVMGRAGEMAFTKSQSPGTFAAYLLDALYEMDAASETLKG